MWFIQTYVTMWTISLRKLKRKFINDSFLISQTNDNISYMPYIRKHYNRWRVTYYKDYKQKYKSFLAKSDAEHFAARIAKQQKKKRKAKYEAVYTVERKLKRKKDLVQHGNTNACESEAIRLLYPILTKANYEVHRVRDGAKADICVRREGEELFHSVQIKSCTKRDRRGTAVFAQVLGYDMPVVCVCNDSGEIWIFRGEELTKDKFDIGRRSKYDVHKVTKDTLANTLKTMLLRYTPREQCYWDTYGLTVNQMKEHVISLQADTIREIDGKPFRIRRSTAIDRVENTVSDCELQFGTDSSFLPAQEKIACTEKNKTGFCVNVHKKGGTIHGKQTQQPYDAGDNAHYIVYLTQLDGKFRSAKTREEVAKLKLVGMYVFPESILIEKGVLSTETQIGKKAMYVYLPDQYVAKLGWRPKMCKTQYDWTKQYFHLL